MKTLSCDLCNFEATAETFEEWLEHMKVHYQEAHADFMEKKQQLTPDQQMAEMNQWMDTMKAKFESL